MRLSSKDQYNKEHLHYAHMKLVFISVFAIFFIFTCFKVSLFMLDSSVFASSVVASTALFLYALASIQRLNHLNSKLP